MQQALDRESVGIRAAIEEDIYLTLTISQSVSVSDNSEKQQDIARNSTES